MLVKGPPAANVEVKFNNVTVLFDISWQTLSICTRAFFISHARWRRGQEGFRVTRDATSPAGLCGSCVSELNNAGKCLI